MPERNFKEILVAVTGLTPQVITESLYYLTQRSKPPSQIQQIFALTTRKGKEKIVQTLLTPKEGKFFKFCKEYGIDPLSIQFDESNIQVLEDKKGLPIEDIRTEEENEATADQIIQFIRRMTQDPATKLHCSIAGGRKTMSLYLGYALQLFGRPQDTLFHVLISPPELESHDEFFYIPRENKTLKTRNGKKIETRKAKIELAKIPHLKLRNKITDLFDKTNDYSKLVKLTQREIDLLPSMREIEIEINYKNRSLKICGEIIPGITPKQLAIYGYFAENKIERCRDLKRKMCAECVSCFMELTDKNTFLEIEKNHKKMIKYPEKELSQKSLRSDISKLNRAIRRALNKPEIENHYCILPERRLYGNTRYGITVDKSKIKILM